MIENDNNFVKKNSNSNFCTLQGPSNHYILAQHVTPLPSTIFAKKSNHEFEVEADLVIV